MSLLEPIQTSSARFWLQLPAWISTLITIFLLLLIWEGLTRYFAVSQLLLPAPSNIVATAISDIASGTILPHIRTTLIEILAGFALAAVTGVALGTAIALSPIFDRTVYPLVVGLQTVPKVALAPLFLIWLGYGVQSKIVTVALICFFPILVNVVTGLRTVDERSLLLMRALHAGPVKTYMKMRFPSMLPYLFAGLEVSLIFSVTGAVVSEFIGGSSGLGTLILTRQAAVDVAGVFSVLFYLSAMGLVLKFALSFIARRYAFWVLVRNLESAGSQ